MLRGSAWRQWGSGRRRRPARSPQRGRRAIIYVTQKESVDRLRVWPTALPLAPTVVLQFLLAVKGEWVLLVGGGCSIAVLLAIAERASGKDIPWPLYVCVLALLFGIACYRAWANERDTGYAIQRRLIAEKEVAANPAIHVEIMEVHPEENISMVGEHPHYIDEYFTVKAHLTNRGRSVAVRRYELLALFEKGVKQTERSTLEPLAIERKQRRTTKYGYRASDIEIVQEKLDDLSLRKAPIGHGESVEGWLRFVLPEISPEELRQSRALRSGRLTRTARRTRTRRAKSSGDNRANSLTRLSRSLTGN
jgi:hypothetical protein